jgi:hypothetical protein
VAIDFMLDHKQERGCVTVRRCIACILAAALSSPHHVFRGLSPPIKVNAELYLEINDYTSNIIHYQYS